MYTYSADASNAYHLPLCSTSLPIPSQQHSTIHLAFWVPDNALHETDEILWRRCCLQNAFPTEVEAKHNISNKNGLEKTVCHDCQFTDSAVINRIFWGFNSHDRPAKTTPVTTCSTGQPQYITHKCFLLRERGALPGIDRWSCGSPSGACIPLGCWVCWLVERLSKAYVRCIWAVAEVTNVIPDETRAKVQVGRV